LLTSITIRNSVTSIGGSAFRSCTSLTSITIPNSVNSIGYNVFENCSSLTSITIPNSVTSIGEYAFSCTSLTSITIPNSVTSIGKSAFSSCWRLTLITIPNSVTSIDSYTFKNCTSLTSITIPNSVTSICYGAFSGCTSLTSIKTSLSYKYFEGTPYYEEMKQEEMKQKEIQITTSNNLCGCYIATSIYGSYNCPQVWTLRRFRDEILYSTWLGSKFVKFYYATSPTLVKYFGESTIFKMTFTTPLNKLVEYLNKKGLSDLEYEDK
ncbi:MAG: leucine-rich repeat domain-containing protein, partial [Clostridia bacterium]